MLHIKEHDGILLMRLEHGKANTIDIALLEGIRGALAEIGGTDATAVVLTGSGKIFSAGVDLFKVLDGGTDYLTAFLPILSDALREIVDFPKPLVAALNGHAIAGGCILACACDYRLMAAGSGRVGVPELRVGVPFPAVPLEILRMVVPPQHLQEVVLLGKTYEPEAARRRGLIDEIVAAEQLEGDAIAIAAELAAVGPEAFRLTKRQLRRTTLDRMHVTAGLYEPRVEELWSAEGTHAKIRAYLEMTVGKGSKRGE